jgi:hypothetical protein
MDEFGSWYAMSQFCTSRGCEAQPQITGGTAAKQRPDAMRIIVDADCFTEDLSGFRAAR